MDAFAHHGVVLAGPVAAQKLDLAASLGNLSLLLRKAGETTAPKSLRVSMKDLFDDVVAEMGAAHSTTIISVRRGTVKEDYSVPIESKDHRASAESGQGQPVH